MAPTFYACDRNDIGHTARGITSWIYYFGLNSSQVSIGAARVAVPGYAFVSAHA